ncbi:Gfo/Idh/MocA family protein [Micromonospora sp. DT229]|uniref:Gfo/Idh/MocA family protein n=1 Tax=Micromonospora sp. DT229 TaxID=3393430 RepID=UPI003CF08007
MRIGVIGLGVIAPYFLRAVEDDEQLTLTAVCDRNETKLADFTDDPRGIATYTDHRELLASGLVDAVVLTLPNAVHAEVAADALRAGVHVCCEKPMTVHLADARELVALARESGRTLFTAFHRRYNRNVAELRDGVGDPTTIERLVCRYSERIEEHTGSEAWYLDQDLGGGGCVIDNGPNALDAVRTIVGDLELVDATIGDVRRGVEFCAELQLRSEHGVLITVELDWALPSGEVKDITVYGKDGSVRSADMLAGFPGFKTSLDHEYAAIMADFRHAVSLGDAYTDAGPDIVALVEQAYAVARRKEPRLRTPSKRPTVARLVKLLFHRRDDRGMTMSPWLSRCVQQGEIHELVTTTDQPTRPGDRVDAVGFLGFAEFATATVVQRGDVVVCNGRQIGTVAGFDECHWPNHYNILIDTDRIVTAEDLSLQVGDSLQLLEAVR